MKWKTLGNEEEILKFIKSIKYNEGKMKIQNKKGGYVTTMVKPPHKDLSGRLKILLNKYRASTWIFKSEIISLNKSIEIIRY